MAGTLFSFFYLLRQRIFSSNAHRFNHPFNIPLPSQFHKILEDKVINAYEEIVVLGDIHGCFDEMLECIETIHWGKSGSILKIFVGDLVNKGEKNYEVLDYLMGRGSQDCLAVRGNHDEKVIRDYFRLQKGAKLTDCDNPWFATLNQDQLDFLMQLPYTITLPSLNVTVVHAGLMPGLALEDNQPFDMVNMRNLIDVSGTLKPTKFDKEGEPWASRWTGPNHIYFGHDAKRGHQKHPYATGMDTGCVYGKQLTATFIKGPRKGEYISIKARRAYQPISETD